MIRTALLSACFGLAAFGAYNAPVSALRVISSRDLTPLIAWTSDGDTWHLTTGERARATDYDAPELFHPRCASERALAERAKASVQTLPVHLTNTGRRDRYGRILAVATVNGEPLAALMVREGLAVPYPLGHHPDWCAAGGVR